MRTRKPPAVVILTSVIPPKLHDMLGAILRYAHEHGPWRIYQAERRLWSYNFNNWEKWGADAIIAADHHSVEEARKIVNARVPTVVLLQPHIMRQADYPLHRFSCCVFDSETIGRMAARHFLDRGYTHFAFVDDPLKETYWSVDRERAFRRELKRASVTMRHYHRYGGADAHEREEWMNERPRLAAWLRELPKPCAVFTPNDRRGKQVLDACIEEGIPVPGEIAVLGVDDDPWICEASVPTLSSIHCDVETAGREIARHLDRLLHEEKAPRVEIPVRPSGITTRQSTDWIAVPDDRVAKTLKFIQENFKDPALCVNALARHVGIARRTLEMRFRAATNKSLLEEIEYVRLSHAKGLLHEKRRSIADIAAACGYNSIQHFSRIFSARIGLTPIRYRRQALGPLQN